MSLTLTRRNGESIMIGDDICITIHNEKRNLTKVIIDAPKDVIIHRKEVFEKIKADERIK